MNNTNSRDIIEIKEIRAIPTLLYWRQEVIEHVFGQKPDRRLLVANRQYYATHIADGSHVALVATYGGEDAGCGAVCLTEELPSPDNRTGKCAYLMNIYVREPFRHKGIAHRIVSKLIELAKRHECGKIYLETTSEGKAVYASLGFEDMPDMMEYYEDKH